MARSFNGSSDHIDAAVASITPSEYSVACWARSSTIATFGYALTVSEFAHATRANALSFRGDVVGDPCELYRSNVAGDSTQGGTYAADTWVHLGGRVIGSTDAALFVNGSKTTDTTSITIFTITRFVLGAFTASSGYLAYLAGQLAEGAWWTRGLDDAEFMGLAKGQQPAHLTHRQPYLGGYAPLIRDLGAAFSATGTTITPHPRVYGAFAK